MASVIDSYSESNVNTYERLGSGGGANYLAIGQSFTGNGKALGSCKFYLRKYGSPTGTAVAKLYAHSGTWGVTGVPTDAALATSGTFNVATLSTSVSILAEFLFASPFTLENGVHYFIVLEYSGGDVNNFAQIGLDNTSPTHGGNYCNYVSSWSYHGAKDVAFYCYSAEQTITGAGGIASAEAFGSPKLNLRLYPAGIASAEAFGSPKLNLRLYPAGIVSGEAVGSPTLFSLSAGAAFAVPAAGTPRDSYAAPTNHPGDLRTYLRAVQFAGEFPVAESDVEQAGRLTLEKPENFDDLVAGDHTGLLLNNRRGLWHPSGPNFIFHSDPDWHRQKKMVRVDFGYLPPGVRTPEMVTLYLGLLGDLGPRVRAVDEAGKPQPHTAEIYSRNWITALMEHKIGLPDADGNSRPLYYGEVLAETKKVSGTALVPPLRTAGFEGGTFDELDRTIVSGGGSLSITTDHPLSGERSARAAVNGAGQFAQAVLGLPAPGPEIFGRYKFRINNCPEHPADDNLFLLEVVATSGDVVMFFVRPDGTVWAGLPDGTWQQSNWNILAYTGVKVTVAVWAKCASAGKVKLWVNGDEALTVDADLSGLQAKALAVGLRCAGTAETWEADIDDLEVGDKYHDQAYQVAGGPFREIRTVYVDKIARSSYVEKYPQYGAVNFLPDPARPDEKDVSGTVELRLVSDSTSHPVDVIRALIAEAGASDYLDEASFAAAKAATAGYVTGCKFDNISAAQAIVEICSRCLYLLYIDHGLIKLSAYTGAALPAPALAVDTSEAREITGTTKLTDLKTRVAVRWGWQERNPDLAYTAGDPEGEGVEIDLTWQSPVATDNEAMATQVADLLLTRLGAREEMNPVRQTLRGARLEGDDTIQLVDALQFASPQVCEFVRKEINLDLPKEVTMNLVKYL